jgi:hypothetical protein
MNRRPFAVYGEKKSNQFKIDSSGKTEIYTDRIMMIELIN